MSNTNTSVCDQGYILWIYKFFGECIVTTNDKISFTIGMISNCIWLFCSAPQIYHNFKTKKVECFSPFYFILIFTADILSLTGAFIVQALATQIITGIIYVLLDLILITQYAIYGHCIKCNISKPSIDNPLNSQSSLDDTISINNNNNSFSSNHAPLLAIAFPTFVLAKVDYSIPYSGSNLFGTVSGWCGTLIYITSRIVQLIKNIKTKYLTDYSPMYIAFLISANATYSISVFIKSLNPQYLWKETPWIIGSLVPMVFDIITAIQMIVFGTQVSDDNAIQTHLTDNLQN